SVFPYDQAYQPFPLPRIVMTFFNDAETRAQTLGDVIPDTGADVCLLPDADCLAIDLFHSTCLIGVAGGAVGSTAPTVIYHGKAEIDGSRFPALIQPVPGSHERIVGRDVLNQLRVLFDGPSGQVVVNP